MAPSMAVKRKMLLIVLFVNHHNTSSCTNTTLRLWHQQLVDIIAQIVDYILCTYVAVLYYAVDTIIIYTIYTLLSTQIRQ